MPLQTSGQITINDIATEFGGSQPHALSEYYDAADGVPSSGIITVSDFYGKAAAISLTITSSQLNFDLYDALIAAGHSSSDISSCILFNITVNGGQTMKGSSTAGNNTRGFGYSCGSGGCGSPEIVPYGGSNQRAGTSRGSMVIEGCPNNATYNVVNNGTFEAGAGFGGLGYNNGSTVNVSGGTGGSPIVMISQNNCTLNITNNGTMRGGGGGGTGGGWGAGHGGCCPKWGGDGQGHNRSAQGGDGASHGGNAGGSGGSWGNGGSESGSTPSVPGLGGTIVELRSCSSTSVNFSVSGTLTSAGNTRSTSSNRA